MVISRFLFSVFSVIWLFCMASGMFLACLFLYSVIAVRETRGQRPAHPSTG